jgi:tetratricopeptide (TPR) repeat protein
MSDRRTLGQLSVAARAYFEKPSDAETTRTLLSLPLALEQWPGASDEEIIEIAPYLSVVFGSLAPDHEDEEVAWARAAVEANERRLARSTTASAAFLDRSADLAWALITLGRAILNHTSTNIPTVEAEVRLLLERAGRLIEDLPPLDARRPSLSTNVNYLLGVTECGLERMDAWRKWLERAKEDLVAMVKAGQRHHPLGGDPRLLLVCTLAWLGAFDEAEDVFGQALEDARAAGDRYNPRLFSSAALFVAMHCGDPPDDCGLRWLERAIQLRASLDHQTALDKMTIVHKSMVVGIGLETRARTRYSEATTRGDETVLLDEAAFAPALRWYELALSYSNEDFDPEICSLFTVIANSCAHNYVGMKEHARALEYLTLWDSLTERHGIKHDASGSPFFVASSQANCLIALGRHAEALVFLRRAVELFADVNAEEAEIEPRNLYLCYVDVLSKIVDTADLLGVAHEVDTQQFVTGSAWCAIDSFEKNHDENIEKSIRWFVRSEEARIHADLPPGDEARQLLNLLVEYADYLGKKGRGDEALSLFERSATLCDAFEDPEEMAGAIHLQIAIALGRWAQKRAEPRIQEFLDETPPRILEVRELIAEPLRYFEQGITRLAPLVKTNEAFLLSWRDIQNIIANLYSTAQLWEQSLRAVDELLASYENAPEVIGEQNLAYIHLTRGLSLRHLGRKEDALGALRRALELVAEGDEANDTRADIRAEIEALETQG